MLTAQGRTPESFDYKWSGGVVLLLLFVLSLPSLLIPPHSLARAPFTPTIPEPAVRQWFNAVKLPGFRQVTLYHEFQPVDGKLVARFEGTGPHQGDVVYLSFTDNIRKDPTYGFPRDAKTMAEIGGSKPPTEKTLRGKAWYGNDTTPSPLVATDLSPEVKVMLMGYTGVDMEALFTLADAISLEILEAAHR